jgi:hypothetical protein
MIPVCVLVVPVLPVIPVVVMLPVPELDPVAPFVVAPLGGGALSLPQLAASAATTPTQGTKKLEHPSRPK